MNATPIQSNIGLPLGLIGFHHYWLRERRRNPGSDLWAYSLNTQAANQHRFARMEKSAAARSAASNTPTTSMPDSTASICASAATHASCNAPKARSST